jgi:hypothetical protein
MNAANRTARIVGSLFLVSNFTFLLGAIAFLEPNLSAPDYLTLVSANKTQVILGAFLEIINAFAYLGIAVLMFPLLKHRFESLALGYVGIRILEFVMQILSDLSPLSIVTLSAEAAKTGAADAASLEALGALLLAERAWAFQMVSVTFAAGALVFYYMLYRARLIPRFISIWGAIGAATVLVNTLLDMFGIPPGNLGIIMLLNELFLGVWLIAKGFDSSAVVSEPTEVAMGRI